MALAHVHHAPCYCVAIHHGMQHPVGGNVGEKGEERQANDEISGIEEYNESCHTSFGRKAGVDRMLPKEE